MDLKEKLLQFSSLKSVDEKFNFWELEMPINYLVFLKEWNANVDYHPFEIIIDKEHQKQYNIQLIETINEVFNANNIQPPIINLIELKTNLEKQIEHVENKKEILALELERVDSVAEVAKKNSFCFFDSYFFYFNEYKRKLDYDLNPDYSNLQYGYYLTGFENGKILAEYQIFISSKLSKLNNKQQAKDEHITKDLTINQIALLLLKSGLLSSMSNLDKTQVTKVLHPLLGFGFRGFYDAIREVHSDGASHEDLKAVKNHMTKYKIKEIQ